MIKKLLVLSAFIILLGHSLRAQCIVNQNQNTGFSPSSLPDAVVGQSYSQVIQFKILTDTTVGPYHGTIQSAVVTDITGKPAGFTYVCSKMNCSYAGGDRGCISISGIPENGSEGTYNLVLKINLGGKLDGGDLFMPIEIPVQFKIVASNGLSVTKAPFFALTQREEDLVLLNPANGKLTVSVFDMLGRVVKSGTYQSIKGEATYINVAGLEKGIYFVNMQLNGKQETIKISKGFY
jgi:hypothetical protein